MEQSPQLSKRSLDAAVLVVEDSEADYRRLERAMQKADFVGPVVRIDHGDEVIDYLLHRGAFAQERNWVRPTLIFLDINLPGESGKDILARMAADDDLKKIPTIIMTTSDDPEEVSDCYARGARGYIVKPFDNSELVRAVERVRDYWLETVELPERGARQ